MNRAQPVWIFYAIYLWAEVYFHLRTKNQHIGNWRPWPWTVQLFKPTLYKETGCTSALLMDEWSDLHQWCVPKYRFNTTQKSTTSSGGGGNSRRSFPWSHHCSHCSVLRLVNNVLWPPVAHEPTVTCRGDPEQYITGGRLRFTWAFVCTAEVLWALHNNTFPVCSKLICHDDSTGLCPAYHDKLVSCLPHVQEVGCRKGENTFLITIIWPIRSWLHHTKVNTREEGKLPVT